MTSRIRRALSLDRGALKVAAVYALVAAAWIYASDALLALFVSDSARLALLSTYKGWAFVAVTSALLYALVRGLHAPGPTREAAPDLDGAPGLGPPLAVFLTISGLIAATAVYVYLDAREALRGEARGNLSAVADLKVRQISAWLAERYGNAARAGQDPFMGPAVEAWLAAGCPDDETARRLRARLGGLREAYGWSEVTLVDTSGRARLMLGRQHPLDPSLLETAREAMRSRAIRFIDLHAPASSPGEVEMGYAAPMLADGGGGQRVVGAVLLELDAERYLQPLVRLWPLPTRSGETLLARREGTDLIFLSELRHRPGKPLGVRLPMAGGLPVAQALLGTEGTVESNDYRGVPVLAALRRVPGTGWVLETKVDREETDARVRRRAVLVAALGLVLVVTAGAAVLFWWRQQRAHALVQRYRAEQERRALVQHFDYLSRYANDAIVLMDEKGLILEVNDRALAAYGFSREELVGMEARHLRADDEAGAFEETWRQTRERGGGVFETVHRRRDGTTFPVEVSSRVIDVDGRGFRQAIVRDVTERKAAEQRIRRLGQLYAALSQMNETIARGAGREELFRELCRVAVDYGEFKFAWVGLADAPAGRVRVAARHGQDAGYLDEIDVSIDASRLGGSGPTGTAIREGCTYVCDDFLNDPRTSPWREQALRVGIRASAALPLRFQGSVIGALNIYATQAGYFSTAGPGGGARDLLELLERMTANVSYALEALDKETQRQAAEQALRESEEKYRLLFNSERDAVVLLDLETQRYLDANDAFLNLLGYSRAALPELGPEHITLDPEGTARAMAVVREHGLARVAARPVHRKDGRRLWVEISMNAFVWKGRRVVSSILRDITERRQAEERMLLWSRVLEDSAEAILIADAGGTILTVNKAFTEITGYEPEEAVGANPRQLLDSGQHDEGFYDAMGAAVAETGRWQGELWSRRKSGEVYPVWLSITAVRGEQGALTHLVGIASDITERKETAQRIHFLAHHDFLTGLPTRALASDFARQALVQSRRRGLTLALLHVDLDRFKSINDSLGHQAGDQLLQRVAERLVACVPAGNTVARLGADEFLVVLPELARGQDAAPVAEQILEAVRVPEVVQERELTVTASIGISIHPHDGHDLAVLLKNAEAAMYHAKDMGRNNFQFFTPDLNARAFEVLSVEMSLKKALERDEFLLLYQPQVHVATGRLVGVEALIRWRHRDLGLVLPTRFIPIAEEHGLILPIGDWVLRTACAQARAWLDAGLPAVPVAVNVSALQFRRAGLPQRLRQILADTGLAPRFLELELTESIVMRQAEGTISILAELQRMGISLSIDDFGTGYSSLSYLRRPRSTS